MRKAFKKGLQEFKAVVDGKDVSVSNSMSCAGFLDLSTSIKSGFFSCL